jgi:hypothetical protein
MDCDQSGMKFHANPRKPLSAERKQATLDRLTLHAPRIVIHSREFSHLKSKRLRSVLGYTARSCPALAQSADITLDVEKIVGYDSSAPNYDKHSLNVLKRSIIRSASILCHELAHAFCSLEVPRPKYKLEPIFNQDPFAEVGCAFEQWVLGGLLNNLRTDGLWLNLWPTAGRLNGYGVFRGVINAPNTLPLQSRWVEPKVYKRHLQDHFWDSEKVETGHRRRCTPFKKTWLRPYHEAPTDSLEWNHFFTGYQFSPSRGNQAKRRRLVGTRGECPRWMDKRTTVSSTIEKSHRVQWLRRKEKMEELKDEFHERELLKAKKFAAKLDAVVGMLERF